MKTLRTVRGDRVLLEMMSPAICGPLRSHANRNLGGLSPNPVQSSSPHPGDPRKTPMPQEAPKLCPNKPGSGLGPSPRTFLEHRDALRRTTTYRDTLRRTSTYYDVLRCTMTHYGVRRLTTTYYDAQRGTMTYYDVLRRTTTYYDILRRTTTNSDLLRCTTACYDVI